MSEMAPAMMKGSAAERAARRAGMVAGHLQGDGATSGRAVSMMAGAGSSTGSNAAIESSSYAKVHGTASRAPAKWIKVDFKLGGKPLEEVIYEKAEGIAKITINRPHRRNAFTPRTVIELIACLEDCKDDNTIGAIIFTGAGDEAFCSGGDQGVRSNSGYRAEDGISRLNFLDLQTAIRRNPKPVVAAVAGYAVGGGHIIHMVCDMTIAADNAIFGQTGPKVGSFDAGYGQSQMARLIGPKRAREMWFMCKFYNAEEAFQMGLVNKVVPLEELDLEAVHWCRQMLANSPLALSVLKAAMNAADDGHAGLQELGGMATKMFYGSAQGLEGLNAYKEKRKPNFQQFRK